MKLPRIKFIPDSNFPALFSSRKGAPEINLSSTQIPCGFLWLKSLITLFERPREGEKVLWCDFINQILEMGYTVGTGVATAQKILSKMSGTHSSQMILYSFFCSAW